MLQILHKGIQFNCAMDQTGFTGDTEVDAALAVVTKMVGGRLGAINSSGVATLADGASMKPIGFIINDAAGAYFENKPALASGKIPMTLGNCVVITDQIDTDLTFDEGELVYAGTSTKVGLITNSDPTPGASFATGDLQSKLVITAALAGTNGNLMSFEVVDGAAGGAATITRDGLAFTITIEDGVTTQTAIKNALEALAEVTSVVADSGATAFTIAGDATDSVTLTGGANAGTPVGVALSSASISAPELQIAVL